MNIIKSAGLAVMRWSQST